MKVMNARELNEMPKGTVFASLDAVGWRLDKGNEYPIAFEAGSLGIIKDVWENGEKSTIMLTIDNIVNPSDLPGNTDHVPEDWNKSNDPLDAISKTVGCWNDEKELYVVLDDADVDKIIEVLQNRKK